MSQAQPDLLYSDVKEDLRASVRDLLKTKAGASALPTRVETAEKSYLKLWRTLADEVGVAGLAVPEELGGRGGVGPRGRRRGRATGRSVAPVRFLDSVVLTTTALVRASAGDFVLRLATGSAIGALAVPLSTAPGAGSCLR
ncbi:hypothetical protein AB0F15_37325 [Amycolatopsis sp. NPDC026612]|uniref:hypothetical protein n=1 Tax=Amycolatopsis sp. NPDC026612 TaxID=3155466 RepID=UPI00340479DE